MPHSSFLILVGTCQLLSVCWHIDKTSRQNNIISIRKTASRFWCDITSFVVMTHWLTGDWKKIGRKIEISLATLPRSYFSLSMFLSTNFKYLKCLKQFLSFLKSFCFNVLACFQVCKYYDVIFDWTMSSKIVLP